MLDLSDKKSMYKVYVKKKPNGKVRIIHAPQGALKLEQEKLAKRIDEMYDPPDCVFGFVKGRNTKQMAQQHIGKDWVVRIDLKDFFPSITKKLLQQYGIQEYWADVATYNGRMIQGSPASPGLSNVVLRFFDCYFQEYGMKENFTYTRYADDIVLSGNEKPKWEWVKHIEQKLAIIGLTFNRSKIKFMFKNERQEVLGICVNDKLSVDRKIRSQLKFRAKKGILSKNDVGFLSYIKGVMS